LFYASQRGSPAPASSRAPSERGFVHTPRYGDNTSKPGSVVLRAPSLPIRSSRDISPKGKVRRRPDRSSSGQDLARTSLRQESEERSLEKGKCKRLAEHSPTPPDEVARKLSKFSQRKEDWPKWVSTVWDQFVKLIKAIETIQNQKAGKDTSAASQLLSALLEEGGIALHLHVPMAIGGPGAHALDIVELFNEIDQPIGIHRDYEKEPYERDPQDKDYRRDWTRVLSAAFDYTGLLWKYRPSVFLAATSGSARV
jgi:hypothetical protein